MSFRVPKLAVITSKHVKLILTLIFAGVNSAAEEVIDVLLLYTESVEHYHNEEDGVRSQVLASFASANMGFENSGLDVRLRLRELRKIDYEEEQGDMSPDLDYITDSSEIQAIREEIGADLVCLFRGGSAGNTIGLAWLLNDPSGRSSRGYSVVTSSSTLSALSFQHEIGHNMGAQHDYDNSENDGIFSYSHGHRFTGSDSNEYRTIMAYDPGTLINYFSDPDISFNGEAIGIASGDQAADNVRTLETTAPIVNGYYEHIHLMPIAVAGKDQGAEDLDGDGFEAFTLDASASVRETEVYTIEWTWPGGSSSEEILTQSFPLGETIVSLTIEDEEGFTDQDTVTISVFPKSPIGQIEAGLKTSFFIKDFGSVWGAGESWYGQLGDHYRNPVRTPVLIESIGVKTISAGENHTLMVMKDGSLWVFGENANGQLGDGTNETRLNPLKLIDAGVMDVSAGYEHSLILMEDGSVLAMGLNYSGQLGDGSQEIRLEPVEIFASGVAEVAAGYNHSLFLKTDGSLWYSGDIAGKGEGFLELEPVEIIASDVASISTDGHSLAVKTDGSLWAFGANYEGQLGDGTNVSSDQPRRILESGVASAEAGPNFTLVVMTDGSLWMTGLLSIGYSDSLNYRTLTKILGSDVTQVSAGQNHALILRDDGTAWALGSNREGQLGTGGGINDHHKIPALVFDSPISRNNAPPIAAAGPDIEFPDGDGDGFAEITLSGSLSTDDWQVVDWHWSWEGGQASGKFAKATFPQGATEVTLSVTDNDGATNQDTLIVIIKPQSGVISVKVGNSHCIILKSDGSLWGSGSNYHGQLGLEASFDVETFTVIEPSGVKAISAGYEFSVFLKEDGSLWGMGNNESKALGPNDGQPIRNPIRIVESEVAEIYGGYVNTFYKLNDGSVWALGENSSGQLGDGTDETKSSPVKIFEEGILSVIPYYDHTLFIKADGSLWGAGRYRFGDEPRQDLSPAQLVESDVTDAAGTGEGIVYLESDGSVWAIGNILVGSIYYNLDVFTRVITEDTTDVAINYLSKQGGAVEIFGGYEIETTLSSGVVDVASNGRMAMIIREDGSLWGIGSDYNGQFGLGERRDLEFVTRLLDANDPISDQFPTADAGLDQSLVDVHGNAKQLAILDGSNSIDDWQVVSWRWVWPGGGAEGPVASGQFSVGTTVVTLTVEDIFGKRSQDTMRISVKPQVEVKSAARSLLLLQDGSVYSLGGENLLGGQNVELPTDTLSNHVISLMAMEEGGQSVVAGRDFAFIIKDDGSLWAFGNNEYGQLGDGTNVRRARPVQIIESGVVSVACGLRHTLVHKEDGSVYSFGNNDWGQLGIGSKERQLLPQRIFDGGIVSVAAGDYHSLFVKDDGTLWGCGSNVTNQLGESQETELLAPVFIDVDVEISLLDGNELQTFIVDNEGQAWSIGSSESPSFKPLKWFSEPVSNINADGGVCYFTLEDGSLWEASSPVQYEGNYFAFPPKKIFFSRVEFYAGGGITIRSDKSVWTSQVSGPPIKVVNGMYPYNNVAPIANAGPDVTIFSRTPGGTASGDISAFRSMDDWQVFRWQWDGGRWPVYGLEDRVSFPFLPGETKLTLTVYDNDYLHSSDEVIVTVADVSVLEEWLLKYFSLEEMAPWHSDMIWADPDNDGLDNTKEYNLGTNPKVAYNPTSDLLLEYKIENGRLVFEVEPYTRGLDYILLTSEDYINWEPIDFESYEGESSYFIVVPDSNISRLYRLRVTQ